ncbi:MAG: XisI protein [Acidobacteriota bacterium]
MDTVAPNKLAKYREIARNIVLDYVNIGSSRDQIAREPVIDSERDHYQVMAIGWQGTRRVHSAVIHLDIIDGKIWIQHDSTDWSVADALIEAGVPQEDIVLGFHPADVRPLTGFAVA